MRGRRLRERHPLKGRVIFFATGNIHKFLEAASIMAELDIAVGMLRLKDIAPALSIA